MAFQRGSRRRDKSKSCRRSLAVGVAVALAVFGGFAAGEESHSHVPIQVDGALHWDALIAATLVAHPQGYALTARAAEAASWTARGHHWLAAAPSLYFSYLSDGPLDDVGQLEYDGGVELPLWRAGQRNVVQAIAESATEASAAAAAALRLEVAGLLRGALWDIEAAANDLAAVRDTVTLTEDLLRVVERRNARGDLSLADVLLARSALLERKQAAVTAAANVIDAERVYHSLTGLDRRPAMFAEERSETAELAPSHPLLVLADAEIARAEHQAELLTRESRGNIALTVGAHRQYDPFGTVPNDSMTFAVKVPVGGGSHTDTARAVALRAAGDAVAGRRQLVRRLEIDLHEAEHGLTVLAESAALAAERRDLAAQQTRMAQIAFAQGEIELRELLRVQETEQAALRDLQRFGIERQRTIAALNQALGETP